MYFNNNYSYRGTFIHIEGLKKNIPSLIFSGIEFRENKASNYGGIIYSNAYDKACTQSLIFNNCYFYDNSALLGR